MENNNQREISYEVKRKKGWFIVAMLSLVMSLGSFFLPIMRYYSSNQEKIEVSKINIIDIIKMNEKLDFINKEYDGPVVLDINKTIIVLLSIVAIQAIVLAIVGLITLRAQRPNKINFVLTIIGLVEIIIPSVIAIVCILNYGKYFRGTLTIGIAPILSPIAVIIAVFAVIRRKNKVAEEYRKEAESKGLIFKAGDL